MLEILKAILFGIVEGITEWLPISSTGHLILLNEFVNLKVSDAFYSMFQVVIQLGAILAVVVLFFKKLNPFDPGKNPKRKRDTWILWYKVIIASVPAGVLGLLLDDWMDAHLYNYIVVAIMLIVYGVGFIVMENRNEAVEPRITNTRKITYRDALLMGCFQCLSLIPGTSRSGATILGGIILGLNRATAAEFSFFMAIPVMAGASGLKLLKFIIKGFSATGTEIAVLVVGCIVSFVVSLFIIRKLMEYVRNHSFASFGVYRIVLGAIVLGYFAVKAFLG